MPEAHNTTAANKAAESIGKVIADNRFRLGLSMRRCARLGALVRAKTGLRMGLSTSSLAKRERRVKSLARDFMGNLAAALLFLLFNFPLLPASSHRHPTMVICLDGYNPGNSFRSQTARKRLAVGLMRQTRVTRFLTVCDRRKEDFRAWWEGDFLSGLQQVLSEGLVRGSASVDLSDVRIAGDHAELWGLFSGCGGSGHRSAFCTTLLADRLLFLHQCPRKSLQEMHDAGYLCPLAGEFSNPCYAITPPLHDIKGLIRLVSKHLPDADQIERALFGKAGGNMTGTQARKLLTALLQTTTDDQYALCSALDLLVFFRYQSIPTRFFGDSNTVPYRKPFVFSLVAYHVLVYLLEWVAPGATLSGYAHSLEHWFDPVDAHPLGLSDERFEHGNGERKRWAACASQQTMERDFLAFELNCHHLASPGTEEGGYTRRPPPGLPEIERAAPHWLTYDTLLLCHCIANKEGVWKTAANSLVSRLETLGLGAHTRQRTRQGVKFVANPSQVTGLDGDMLVFCVCKKEKWASPAAKPESESSGSAVPSEEASASDSESASSDELHTCTCCGQEFGSLVSLFAHYDSVHRPPSTCECKSCRVCKTDCPREGCSKVVASRGLSQHLFYAHFDELSQLDCPVCGLRFPHAGARDNHMQQDHDYSAS